MRSSGMRQEDGARRRDQAARGLRLPLRRPRLERVLEHLVHGVDEDEAQRVADAGAGTSSRSFSLRRGRMTRLDAGAPRRQHLLLDAADRQHLAAQRDLAGHRDVRAHRAGR